MRPILEKIARHIYAILNKDYTFKLKGATKNALISYITEPFSKRDNSLYLNKHQNRREVLIIADIFRNLNISTKFTYLSKPHFSLSGFDLIFGVEPNFIKACKDNPSALKIYYATGAYCKHQNSVVIKRTDEFNQKHGTNIPYIRMVKDHASCEIADHIIQIGSKFTLTTYPEKIKKKIYVIRQSCHEFHFNDFLTKKLKCFSRNEFIWMGSQGSILKGFDLLADFFIDNPQYIIHFIGSIDTEVWNYYKEKFQSKKNIHCYGYVDLDSELMEKLALRSTYVIMPSASEGCPGSVINMMKLGCIPIVSPYAAFNEIENMGFLIEDFTTAAIKKAIDKVNSITNEEIIQKIELNYRYSNLNFNAQVFNNDLTQCMISILNNNNEEANSKL